VNILAGFSAVFFGDVAAWLRRGGQDFAVLFLT
jgi:hypothetical protein